MRECPEDGLISTSLTQSAFLINPANTPPVSDTWKQDPCTGKRLHLSRSQGGKGEENRRATAHLGEYCSRFLVLVHTNRVTQLSGVWLVPTGARSQPTVRFSLLDRGWSLTPFLAALAFLAFWGVWACGCEHAPPFKTQKGTPKPCGTCADLQTNRLTAELYLAVGC